MDLIRLVQPMLVLALYGAQFTCGLPEPRQEGPKPTSLPAPQDHAASRYR